MQNQILTSIAKYLNTLGHCVSVNEDETTITSDSYVSHYKRGSSLTELVELMTLNIVINIEADIIKIISRVKDVGIVGKTAIELNNPNAMRLIEEHLALIKSDWINLMGSPNLENLVHQHFISLGYNASLLRSQETSGAKATTEIRIKSKRGRACYARIFIVDGLTICTCIIGMKSSNARRRFCKSHNIDLIKPDSLEELESIIRPEVPENQINANHI